MSQILRRLISSALSAISRLLPHELSHWPRAMQRELAEIDDDRAALRFAVGCLGATLSLAIATRLRSACDRLFPITSPQRTVLMNERMVRPRNLGLICGGGAVALGLVYMAAAGAPPIYLMVNLASLVLGATSWVALSRLGQSSFDKAGTAVFAMALALLATAIFGAQSEGAARWVSVGPLSVQVSLVLLPVMLVLYGRRPDAIGTAGMALGAAALAAQPDRAMAGVMLASLSIVALASRARLPILASAVACAAFAWTLTAPDALPAVPYVDGVLFTAFDIHPLIGSAVVFGAAALLMPVFAAAKRADQPSMLLAFAACWASILVAAALGNYPTPLVGYGGSAILGYLASVALLPSGGGELGRGSSAYGLSGTSWAVKDSIEDLRVALPV